TPTATVGIRGTGGLIQVQNDGSTLVQGTSGIWFLANPAGTIDIPAGVAGIAPVDPKLPPKETLQIPTAGPSPLPMLIEFVQGEEREADGENVIETATEPTPPPALLMSGSGYLGAVTYGWFGGPQMSLTPDATATFDSMGRMTAITDSIGQIFTSDASSITDFGNDGIIAWGRWTGNVTGLGNIDGLLTIDEIYSANQGLHYVVGLPTATMPPSGSATYNLLGATSPTFIDGSTAPGTFSGSLNVDFGRLTVGMNLNVVMSTASYAIGGAAQISANTFSGSADPFGGGNLSISGTNCSCSCSALVNGFFAGPSAERAGLGYHISNSNFTVGRDVVGTAAFQQ
ncbi:MAG TPA: hypothetical protein VMN03_10665, partial [Burkholderiales bacterium]|nr:hypothetical protein [Burkholderiales bacterium]